MLRDEDVDLTINELSRLRGRLPKAADEPRRAFDGAVNDE